MLSETVYEALIDMLMNGELVPGQIIKRADIASKLGVSIAPVLEAMLRLEAEGFIETIPRKGSQIKIVRKEDVIGNLLVKIGIECMAVRYYCGKKVRDNYDRLYTLAADFENSFIEYGPVMKTWKKDFIFHNALIELCDNPILSKYFSLSTKPGLYYGVASQFMHYTNIKTSKSDHMKLLDALCTDDKDKAEATLREHLFNDKSILSEYI